MASLKPQVGLSKRASGPLSKQERNISTGALEAALLRDFPREDAEEWDRTGLTVGDPARPVTKVAVGLDATVAAVREAASRGANVLVTHHPAFLKAPESFRPAESAAQCSGAVVWAAIEEGVSLMSFHTALDASPRAATMLPDMLSLDYTGRLVMPTAPGADRGYGHRPARGIPATRRARDRRTARPVNCRQCLSPDRFEMPADRPGPFPTYA